MNYRITITAGTGYTATGRELSEFERHAATRKARAYLADAFGGYTETITTGGWLNGSELVEEPGRRWTVLTEGSAEKVEGLARLAAETIAAAFRQECVVLEVERVATVAFVEAPAALAETAA